MLNEEKYFEADELLDEALKTDPQFILSDNFADVLAEKMGRRFAWEQYIKEFLIYLAAIVGLAGVTAGIQFVWFDASWKEWLQLIAGNVSLISGIIFLLVFVLFTDRVLLRYFMHRSSAGLI